MCLTIKRKHSLDCKAKQGEFCGLLVKALFFESLLWSHMIMDMVKVGVLQRWMENHFLLSQLVVVTPRICSEVS